MSDMPKEIDDRYKEDAELHATFLCEQVFKPAFIMAFRHGAKHMYDEMKSPEPDLRTMMEIRNKNE